ncbi:hypothetical protein Tsubulata_021987, partial [Turnera subulata]
KTSKLHSVQHFRNSFFVCLSRLVQKIKKLPATKSYHAKDSSCASCTKPVGVPISTKACRTAPPIQQQESTPMSTTPAASKPFLLSNKT